MGGTLSVPLFFVKETYYLNLNLGYYSIIGNLENEIGTFSYLTSDKYEHVEIYDDGVINRCCTLIPISLNYNVFFRFWDDNILLRFGPSIGETTLIASNEYIANGKSWEPDTSLKEKDLPASRKAKAVFNCGANTNIKYIGNKLSIGVGYQFMLNRTTFFKNEAIRGGMHQISILLMPVL